MTTEVKSASAKKNEDWMNNKWRPMMGWTYMLTCLADFVIFPVLWSVAQAMGNGQVNIQWQPITLQGAGLFHIAMGAILGIAVYGRTKEKLEGANNGGLQPVGQSVTTTYSAPQSGFGTSSGGVGSPTPAPFGRSSFENTSKSTAPFGAPATTMMSSTGKPMPIQSDQPEL